jgi:thiol-disulfide isomerase/thioredoxin
MSIRRIIALQIAFSVFAVAMLAFAFSDDAEPAPHFHAKTLTGEAFTNDTVKGKVVLLQFWTTWCQYCRGDEPVVDRIEKQFENKGLIVLAIDVGESKKTVKKYLAEHPRSCRVVLNDDTNLAAMYAATVYPIYVVIDRDGNIAAEQRGTAGESGIRNMLRRAGLSSD